MPTSYGLRTNKLANKIKVTTYNIEYDGIFLLVRLHLLLDVIHKQGMNPQIQKYKPPLRLIDNGNFLDISNEKIKKNESIVLAEQNHNLIGDLVVRFGLIVIPVIFTQIEITYADSISKVVGIIIGVLMLVAGITLLPETIRKLKDTERKSSLEINKNGITLNNTEPYKSGFFPWQKINEIAIKVFPNRYSGDPYLLIATDKGKLVDINLSHLKRRGASFWDKEEWMKTLKMKDENFEEVIACIQKYMQEKF